jgi:GNAT superfamily N-acetyltransferase
MTELQIRPAREEDVPTILGLIRGLAEYERLAHEVTASEDALRASLFGAHPSAEVVIAYVSDTPAGFALWFHNYSTFLAKPGLYLEDLFVLPAFRGRGIGKALLTHLAGIAVDRGCGRMEWTVLDWNAPAIGFYERIGARRMAEWNLYRMTGAQLDALAAGVVTAGGAAR